MSFRALGFTIPVVHVHGDDLTSTNLAEEDLLGQNILDFALNGATQRTSTQDRVETALGQELLGIVGEFKVHVLGLESLGYTADQQVHHLDDFFLRELVEDHNVVNTVQELGAEVLLQLVVDLLLHALVLAFRIGFPDAAEAHAYGLGIREGHRTGGTR